MATRETLIIILFGASVGMSCETIRLLAQCQAMAEHVEELLVVSTPIEPEPPTFEAEPCDVPDVPDASPCDTAAPCKGLGEYCVCHRCVEGM